MWNLARRLAKHACSTIYRCLALIQMLCRWRHQSGNFWINPRTLHSAERGTARRTMRMTCWNGSGNSLCRILRRFSKHVLEGDSRRSYEQGLPTTWPADLMMWPAEILMIIILYSPYYFHRIIQSGNSAKLNPSSSLHNCICCIKKYK